MYLVEDFLTNICESQQILIEPHVVETGVHSTRNRQGRRQSCVMSHFTVSM